MDSEEKTIQNESLSNQEVPTDDLISKLIASSKDPRKTLSIEAAQEILRETRKFIKESFKVDIDYRIVGKGRYKHSSLLKPGGEKLGLKFLLRPEYDRLDKVLDWENRIFYFEFRCRLIHIPTGLEIAQAVASCNSREENYRYQWIYKSEIPSGIDVNSLVSKEKESDTGKYKVYRMDNPNIEDQINTIVQMSQKRSYLTAMKNATQTSDEFEKSGGMDNGGGKLESPKSQGKTPPLSGIQKPEPTKPPPASPPPPSGKISLATKTGIINGARFVGLTDEEEERLNKKLDAKNPEMVTDKDLFTEAEGQKMLKYFALRVKAQEVKDAIGSHFGGDEEQMKKFVRETLGLHQDISFEKLILEQIEKLGVAIKKAEEGMPF